MRGSTISLIAGGLAFLAGVIALLFPLPAGLAITSLVGVAFLVSGAFGLFGAFSDPLLPQRGWIAVLSGLQLILGIWVLANPLAGLISLTIFAGLLFLLSGIGRVMIARQLRGRGPFWPLLISGLLSVALGIYALFFPTASGPVLLGTLLAAELILIGAALISLGLALRQLR